MVRGRRKRHISYLVIRGKGQALRQIARDLILAAVTVIDRSMSGANMSRGRGQSKAKKGRNNMLRRDVRDVFPDRVVPVVGHTYYF
jgi:hypothetical protein